jgi:hypothetical protein
VADHAYRWASVSAREFPGSGYQRHLVPRGGITSACSTTATDPTIWRANTRKPKCPTCERRESALLKEADRG